MKVGILGAGQLSRMLALAGIPQGIHFSFYADKPSLCVDDLGEMVVGENDDASLKQFLENVDVVTYENENISKEVLEFIQAQKPVYPGIEPLKVIQDRLLEKDYLNSIDIPTVKYYPINSLNEIGSQIPMPFVIKKRRNGYDGKGQYLIKSQADLEGITDSECEDAIIEAYIRFDREVSLVAVRGTNGQMVFYDIAENYHQNAILRQTQNKKNDKALSKAKSYMENLLTALNYVGTCTIEFFERDGELIANEIAPRVHNSGHWTIEGAVTSQFANHIRAILSLPLGDTTSLGEYMMYNLIGKMPDFKKSLSLPGVYYHDYEKAPRAARKLGHLTVIKNASVQKMIEDELVSL